MENFINILKDHKRGVEWLYQKYGHKLHGYATKVYNVNEDTAWDLVYKTIYKMLQIAIDSQFENEDKFASYMFRTFINYLKNHFRDEKTKTGGAVIISLEDSKRDFASRTKEVQPSNQVQLLKSELDKLEPWQRILLLMRSQGTEYSEIAKYVNKPEDQLKVYYQRLKNKLGETLKEKFENLEQIKNAANK